MNNNSRKPLLILIVMIASCFLSSFAVNLIDMTPSFLTLDIHLPAYNDAHDWSHTIHSIWQNGDRNYIWRRDATNLYNENSEFFSVDDIENYFDKEMLLKGWEQSNVYVPCNAYVIEYSFFEEYNDIRLWSYTPVSLQTATGNYFGDYVVAAWQSAESRYIYTIFMTVRPSLLSRITGWIFSM